MNRRIGTLALVATSLTLTLSAMLVGCDGQTQALQQQIDALQKKQADSQARMQVLESQVRTVTQELVTTKTLVQNVATTVLAQKEAITRMNATIQETSRREASKSVARATASRAAASKTPVRPAARKPVATKPRYR